MWKFLAVAFAAAAVLDASAQGRATVPSSLLAAARDQPIQFAMALTKASIPAGFEIRESDDGAPLGRPSGAGEGSARLSDVAKAFETYHRDYRAVVMGSVLVVRPRKGAASVLDAPSAILERTKVTGIMAAARHIFSARWPALLGPTLNSFGRPGEDIDIVLDGRGRRVIDTLNEIVMQAPNRAWVVTTRHEGEEVQISSFGFLDSGGHRSVHSVSGLRDGGERHK